MPQKILIVVDMQNDFVDGSLGTPEAQAVLPRVIDKIRRQLAAYGLDSVLYTMDTHQEDYLSTQEGRNLPVRHCIRGTDGWQLHPEVRALLLPQSVIIEKGGFGAPSLPKAVPSDAAVELVGLCTGICVISNAVILKTAFPEMEISIDASCCACVSPESHERALAAMELLQFKIER